MELRVRNAGLQKHSDTKRLAAIAKECRGDRTSARGVKYITPTAGRAAPMYQMVGRKARREVLIYCRLATNKHRCCDRRLWLHVK